jgi:hypothetical protein
MSSSLYVVRLTNSNVDDIISRISFSEPEVNSQSSNSTIRVYITDEQGEQKNLVVETPWMKCPFGVSVFEAQSRKGSPYKKYSLPVSFHKQETDEKQQVYKRFLELLDEKLIDAGHENAGAWLKQKGQPKAVIKAFYTGMLRYSKNPDGSPSDRYPPNTKYKLPAYRNDGPEGDVTFSTQVFSSQDKDARMTVTDIAKGAQVKNLVECTGIWVVNGKFGVGWRSLQMRVKNPESRNTYAFQEDSDDEDEEA